MCDCCVCAQEAIAASSFYPSAGIPVITKGDVATALKHSTTVVSGSVAVGGQKHMYMETQNAVARVQEDDTIAMIVSSQVWACVCVCLPGNCVCLFVVQYARSPVLCSCWRGVSVWQCWEVSLCVCAFVVVCVGVCRVRSLC